MSVAENITEFAETVTRKRAAAGSTSADTGAFSRGTETSTSMEAVVYPARAREVQRLSEGLRDSDAIVVVCVDALQTAKDTGGPDRIIWQGGTYEVQTRERWSHGGFLTHVCTMVEQ